MMVVSRALHFRIRLQPLAIAEIEHDKVVRLDSPPAPSRDRRMKARLAALHHLPPVRANCSRIGPSFRRLRFSRVLRSPVVSAHHQTGLVALLSKARWIGFADVWLISCMCFLQFRNLRFVSLATCLARSDFSVCVFTNSRSALAIRF